MNHHGTESLAQAMTLKKDEAMTPKKDALFEYDIALYYR